MFKKETFNVTMLAAACMLAPVAAAGADSVSASARDSISRETVSRQQVISAAQSLLQEANEAFGVSNYTLARDSYIKAKQAFQKLNGADVADELEFCDKQIGKCYFYMAQDAVVRADEYAKASDYDKAIALCREAAEFYPESRDALLKKAADFEKERVAATIRDASSVDALMPDKENQDYRIAVLMAQGQKFMSLKQYDKAARKYKDVLLINPYNADALYNLRSANVRSGKVAEDRYNLTHRKQITELEWKWGNPVLPEGEQPMTNAVAGPVAKNQGVVNSLEAKLKNLIIPYEIALDDVSVAEAVNQLQKMSKVYDPEGKGVNIYLRRPDKESTAAVSAEPAAEAGPGRMPGSGNSTAETTETISTVSSDDGSKKINLIIPNQSLYDALKLLCQVADFNYRIEEHAVVVAPKSVALEDFETQVFPVERTVFDDIDMEGDSKALQGFWEVRGVHFPTGAKVVYDSRISRLIVTNTPENNQKLHEVLQKISSEKPAMVEISAKFIEVSQDDLKELGFDHMISFAPKSENGRLSFGDSMTELTRTGLGKNSDGEYTHDITPSAINIGVANTETGMEYWTQIFAQNRISSADVLASPRITTLEGTTAHIEMVQERAFVDEYDEGETSNSSPSSSSNTGTNAQTYTEIGPFPKFAEPEKLGIVMDVRPEVDRKGEIKTIRLKMNPKITSWREGDYDYFETETNDTATRMRKPRIKVREVDTTVTIADGETIVLGGVIEDSTQAYLDKVPILGELPLVGRFFQSRSSVAVKKNLLIFMTCRLVNPDGTALYPSGNRANGLPDSGRLD